MNKRHAEMDLIKALAAENNKRQITRIARYIGRSEPRLRQLISVYFGADEDLSRRAGWVMTEVAAMNTSMLYPFLKKIMVFLRKENQHDGIRRNGLKVLELTGIPPRLNGLASSLCFDILASRKESVAARCYAMTVLEHICQTVPELKNELRMILQESLPYGSAAYRSRARKIQSGLTDVSSGHFTEH